MRRGAEGCAGVSAPTDGGDDGDGVKQRAGERPLHLHVVVATVTDQHIVVVGVRVLVHLPVRLGSLALPVAQVDAHAEREVPLVVPRETRQVPDVADRLVVGGLQLFSRDPLGGRLQRLEEETTEDGVGDHEAGQPDVRAEERHHLLAVADDSLAAPTVALSPLLGLHLGTEVDARAHLGGPPDRRVHAAAAVLRRRRRRRAVTGEHC